MLQKVLADVVKNAGVWGPDQQLAFPLITRSGVNQQGKAIHYYFNYSATSQSVTYPHKAGQELLSGEAISQNKVVELGAWGVKIVEEK